MLKVCHISTMTQWGGVERMLVDLLLNVQQECIEHLLLTTSSKPDVLQPILDKGISHYEPSRAWHYDPRALWRMALWLKQKRVNVVHTYNAFANSWGTLAARLAQIPIVFTGEHGSILTARPSIRWLDRIAQNQATAVIANSNASKKLLHLKYQVPLERIYVVANAVEPLIPVDKGIIRKQLGLSKDDLVVGSVGRLDMPKDYPTFIESAALILKKYRQVVFVLVGGGLHENLLKDLVEKRGISDRFMFTGWRADARKILQVFDIFVSTSLQESFGNTLVEAALAGIPVIAPAVGGVPDVVINHETGILLTPSEPVHPLTMTQGQPLYKEVLIEGHLTAPQSLSLNELSDAIANLIEHPDLRTMIGLSAQKRAEKLFNIHRYINDLESIYSHYGEGE